MPPDPNTEILNRCTFRSLNILGSYIDTLILDPQFVPYMNIFELMYFNSVVYTTSFTRNQGFMLCFYIIVKIKGSKHVWQNLITGFAISYVSVQFFSRKSTKLSGSQRKYYLNQLTSSQIYDLTMLWKSPVNLIRLLYVAGHDWRLNCRLF